MGENGAGHFVKMVHNGIEYGDMQLIGEAVFARCLSAVIVSYTQGYQLLRAAAKTYGWNLNYGGIALVWRGSCIIRSAFLGDIKKAFKRNPDLVHLLLDKFFKKAVSSRQTARRILPHQLDRPRRHDHLAVVQRVTKNTWIELFPEFSYAPLGGPRISVAMTTLRRFPLSRMAAAHCPARESFSTGAGTGVGAVLGVRAVTGVGAGFAVTGATCEG
jgi:hypothetical protein